MSDYISREKAVNAAIDAVDDWDGGCNKSRAELIEREMNKLPAADVRPVVLCKDCEWWEKQKDSAQGRCALMGMYPTGGWFCANGKREGPK